MGASTTSTSTWIVLRVTYPCLRPVKRTRLQASNTWAKSPMNMYRHKICRNRILKENALQYNMHKRNCLSYTAIIIYLAHRNQHAFTQSFILNMFIISLTGIMVAEVELVKITYLMMNSFRNQLRRCNVPPNHRLACSLISRQRCHPRAGHDYPRNKGTTGLHIAKNIQTQPRQHSWVYQAIKELEKANC